MKKLALMLLSVFTLSLAACGSSPTPTPSKKDFSGISFADESVTYDGAQHTIVAKGIPEGAVATYKDNGPFVDAGSYPMSVVVAQDGYNDWKGSATLTIQKATMSVVFEDSTITFDGEAHNIRATGYPEGSTVVYTPDQSYTNPGTYPIAVKITNKNYVDFEKTATLKIEEKEMTGVVFEDSTVTYDGEAHSIAATGYPEGATVEYNPQNPSFTDAGEYDIEVVISKTGYATFRKTATLTIEKAEMNVEFKDQSISYDGKGHTIEATGYPEGSTVTYTGEGPHTNAGEYVISVQIENKNYVTWTGSAKLTINKQADAKLVIEDVEGKSDNDLVDEWGKIMFFKDTGWVESASAAMNVAEETIPEKSGTQVVKVKTTHQGSSFKLTKAIQPGKGLLYDGFAIDVRKGTSNKQTIKLQYWLDNLPLPEEYSGYKKSYVTYTLTTDLADSWTHFEVPLNDAGWSFNGQTQITMAMALQLMGLSASQLPQYMTEACLLIVGAYIEGGPTAYTYFDNYELLPSCSQKVEELLINKVGGYTGKSAKGVDCRLDLNKDKAVIKTTALESNYVINLDATYAGNVVTLAGQISTKDIKFTGTITKNGEVITITKVEADSSIMPLASQIGNIVYNKFYVLDDFESYTETGVGYDQSHAESQKSGLRGAYYCDYYAGSGSSRMGGNNWMLMGSSDYLALETSKIHNGAKSGNFKLSTNQMRYTTFGLSDGSAVRVGNASKLSFFINPTVATTFKVRVYYYPHVTPSDQTSGDMTEYTFSSLTANEWKEYVMDINVNKDIYGISLIPGKVAGRLYIDDIRAYTDVSPDDHYVAPSPEAKLANGTYYYWSGAAASSFIMNVQDAGSNIFSMDSTESKGAFTKEIDGQKILFKDSQYAGQGLTLECSVVDEINFKVDEVTGQAASTYSGALKGKTFKYYEALNRTFESGVVGNSAYTDEWKVTKYSGSGWVDVTSPSMYYKSANGGKVMNVYAGWKTDYIYVLTPKTLMGPMTGFSIDLAAYWKADTIKVKISLLDNSGGATFVYGTSDAAAEVTQSTATQQEFKNITVSFGGVKFFKSIKIYVKNNINEDNFLYLDNFRSILG